MNHRPNTLLVDVDAGVIYFFLSLTCLYFHQLTKSANIQWLMDVLFVAQFSCMFGVWSLVPKCLCFVL